MRELGASEPQETSRVPTTHSLKTAPGVRFCRLVGLVERAERPGRAGVPIPHRLLWRWRTRSPGPASPVRLKGADRLTGGCGPAPPRRPPTPLTLEEPSSNHTVLERPRGPNCRQAGRGWGRRGGAVLSSRSPSPFRPRSIELPPCPLAGGSWRRLRAR